MNGAVMTTDVLQSTLLPTVYNTTSGNVSEQCELGCIDDSKEWRPIFSTVCIVGSSILIVVGTIGNSVTYIVLKQKTFRDNIMSSALRYLAVLDIIILWTVVMEIFIYGVFDYDIPSASWETCAVVPFYYLAITSLNSWLLVVITGTRLVHLMCPFHVKTICSQFNYYAVLILIHVGVVSAHGAVQFTIYFDHFQKDTPMCGSCYFNVNKAEKENPILMMTTISTNFLVPSVFMIVFTIAMVIGLRRLERNNKALYMKSRTLTKSIIASATDFSRTDHSKTNDQTNNARYIVEPPKDMDTLTVTSVNTASSKRKSGIFSIISASMNEPVQLNFPTIEETKTVELAEEGINESKALQQVAEANNDILVNAKSDKRLNSLTRLLICACLIYLILNIPFWVFHLFLAKHIITGSAGCYEGNLIPYITFLIQYFNHSINFYIYCAAGSQFRNEFFKWFNANFRIKLWSTAPSSQSHSTK